MITESKIRDGRYWVPVPSGTKVFLTNKTVKTACLWVPTSILLSDNRNYFPEVRRPGRDINRSRPSSDEIKNEWSYTFFPPYAFMTLEAKNLTFSLYSCLYKDIIAVTIVLVELPMRAWKIHCHIGEWLKSGISWYSSVPVNTNTHTHRKSRTRTFFSTSFCVHDLLPFQKFMFTFCVAKSVWHWQKSL